jgi:LAS superfamily LD-carboxypeptidase LdcB
MKELDSHSTPIGPEFFTDDVKRLTSSAIDDVDRVELGDEITPPDPTIIVMSWERLQSILSAEQFELIQQLTALNPAEYGFKGDRVATTDQPREAFTLTVPQTYREAVRVTKDGVESVDIVEKATLPQFVPTPAYEALERLNGAMQEAIGKQVLVESGYRSPAYQMMLFLTFLRDEYGYDIELTTKRVALPDYSEHSSFEAPALDVQSADALPVIDDPTSFELMPEFVWLQQNAQQFGFRLSYPRDNDKGVMYEPWHWRFDPEAASSK